MTATGCSNSTCWNTPCETCQPTCYSEQSFCTISGQSASNYYSHSWPSSFSKDQVIYNVLPRSVFNSAITYINNALHKGKVPTSSWSGSAETRDFIYADKVNEILTGLSKFSNSPGSSISRAAKDTVIYADYFNKIANALDIATLSPAACDDCNTDCNVECKDCQGCVECEGCNTCQGYAECHSPCHLPCHTPCHTPCDTPPPTTTT